MIVLAKTPSLNPFGRVLVVLVVIASAACLRIGEGSGDDAGASSETMVAGELFRIAPDQCPPDPVTGEDDLWSAPDTIDLGGVSLLELQGCESPGDGWVTLNYVGAASAEPYHVVEVRYYEGGGWIVANARSRAWTFVRGEPLFAPDGQWVATAVVDLEANYDPNHLDVWAIGEDSLVRALRLDGGQDWGATLREWVSPTELGYYHIRWKEQDASGSWLDSVPHTLRLVDGAWIEEAGND